jgi:hypothetical protein
MRWDNLFDDLEGQLEREMSAEETDVQAEEERLRLARLSLRERVMALRRSGEGDTPLRVSLINGESVVLLPAAFGRDWFSADLVDDSARRSRCLVPLAAIASISISLKQIPVSLGHESPRNIASGSGSGSSSSSGSGLRPGQGPGPGSRIPRHDDGDSLSARLGLPFVLRDLCRRRAAVEVATVSGRHHGTIDRVGRDHFDLAEHERGVPRRSEAVTGCRIIPIAQLAFVLM